MATILNNGKILIEKNIGNQINSKLNSKSVTFWLVPSIAIIDNNNVKKLQII